MDRHRYLAGQGVSSPQAVDQARADLDTAKARYELMTQRLALLTAPPRAEDLAIATANLELAKADASALEAQIEKTRLRSPVDGVLLRRYKALGETVSENPPTLVAKIGDVSRLRVKAEIDERDVARVSRGQRVFITADAYGDQRFSGRVTKVGVWVGRKRVWTEASAEKTDTKILEVIIEPDSAIQLPPGLRVDVMFEPLAPVTAQVASPTG
jgi:HlyD family secretion protein